MYVYDQLYIIIFVSYKKDLFFKFDSKEIASKPVVQKEKEFYIFGESYGGKYAPNLAAKIHEENKNAKDNIFINLGKIFLDSQNAIFCTTELIMLYFF